MTDYPLTDEEWFAFQAIPDQGYSHRAWIEARIAERVAKVTAERDEALHAYETWHVEGLRLHDALLSIWRGLGDDRKHMTFGTDPEVVVTEFFASAPAQVNDLDVVDGLSVIDTISACIKEIQAMKPAATSQMTFDGGKRRAISVLQKFREEERSR
jgi:hypothetical protein